MSTIIKSILKILAIIIVFDNLLLLTTDIGDEQDELAHRIMAESSSSSSSSLIGSHKLGTLNCSAHGGPEDASEMVYWHDIPSDATFMANRRRAEHQSSSSNDEQPTKYLSFELDSGEFEPCSVYVYTQATKSSNLLPAEQGGRFNITREESVG